MPSFSGSPLRIAGEIGEVRGPKGAVRVIANMPCSCHRSLTIYLRNEAEDPWGRQGIKDVQRKEMVANTNKRWQAARPTQSTTKRPFHGRAERGGEGDYYF